MARLSLWRSTPEKIAVIDVHEAWKRFPPVDLDRSPPVTAPADNAQLSNRIADEIHRIDRVDRTRPDARQPGDPPSRH